MFKFNGKLVTDVLEYDGIYHFYNANGWVIGRVTNEFDKFESKEQELKAIAQEYGDKGEVC
jgi:hypothetical protein